MVASPLTTTRKCRPCVHNHNAHPSHSAAGASEKTPTTDTTPTTSSTAEMIASGSVQRFHETKLTPKAARRKTAAINRDVTQSQLTTGESLLAEHPHGLDAMTKTDSKTATSAAAPKTKAMMLVVRACGLAAESEANSA